MDIFTILILLIPQHAGTAWMGGCCWGSDRATGVVGRGRALALHKLASENGKMAPTHVGTSRVE